MKPKQLKDKEHTEAVIKISKVREVFKDGNAISFKDKLICIKIIYPWGDETSTCFKDTKKGRKDLLNWIGEELYLKSIRNIKKKRGRK